MNHTFQIEFVLLSLLFLFRREIWRTVFIRTDRLIIHILNTLRIDIRENAFQSNILNGCFNKYHFTVEKVFKLRIILNGGIYFLMQDILGEVKKGDLERVAFKSEQLRKYFPKSYSPKQMQDTIIKLLEQWQRKRQRDQER